jgi:hypothetical protein
MTTLIWIEPVLRPDGRPWYVPKGERIAKSGLLYRTRLGGPQGEVLCERVFNPVCESCRALKARGIVGPFETRKPDIDYPCMTGDIETAAGLTIKEPDDGVLHFAGWRPFGQNALSRSPILAPARDRPGKRSRMKQRLPRPLPRRPNESATMRNPTPQGAPVGQWVPRFMRLPRDLRGARNCRPS